MYVQKIAYSYSSFQQYRLGRFDRNVPNEVYQYRQAEMTGKHPLGCFFCIVP